MTTTEMDVTKTALWFAAGVIDKFDAYPAVFRLMDQRRITLARIADIFVGVGAATSTDVVRMRRRDYLNGAL